MITEKCLRFLIIDDEKEIINSIKEYFSQYNTECIAAFNLQTALNCLTNQFFDFVLLDLNLPDGHGFRFLEEASRLNYRGNIIIISGNNSVQNKITGFNIGSDDYLVKPVSLPFLTARIRNLYYAQNTGRDNVITFREIVLNPSGNRAFVNNTELNLTKTEFELLVYLVHNAKKILTRESIARYLYRYKYDIDNSFEFIYSHIKNLKKKISEYSTIDYIKTIYGIGYMLSLE